MQLVVVVTFLFCVQAYGTQNAYGADNSELDSLQAQLIQSNANHSRGQSEDLATNPKALKQCVKDKASSILHAKVPYILAKSDLGASKSAVHKDLTELIRCLSILLKDHPKAAP